MIVHYLSLEEILRIHYQLVEDFGGSHGVRDEGRIKSVVEAPKQEVYNQQQYPSVFEKAAVYLRNIVGDHPFTDGNKRTGITVCGIFLMRNKHKLKADPQDLELFTVRVATERLNIPDIAAWLQSHSD